MDRIFLAFLPRENGSSDAVPDGCTIRFISKEMTLQVAVPFGCPSFEEFPRKDLERGAVPSGRSSLEVLPKKDL